MTDTFLVRFAHTGQGPRVGAQIGDTVYDITEQVPSVAAWLVGSAGLVERAIAEIAAAVEQAPSHYGVADFGGEDSMLRWLAPVDEQAVWAAGVTYKRSQEARQEESADGGDIYARVYAAERPELFFKAHGAQVIGPEGMVGIRQDSAWNVPEPELALVINPAMEVVGVTAGNDMSSRDIEGANPLYLPQAKVYTASCALGPGIRLGQPSSWPDTTIHLEIAREGQIAFAGSVHTSSIHRTMDDLVTYLGRSNSYPQGVVLLTGTGIVPPGDFTLAAGDVVRITIEGIGTLVNTVKIV